MPLTADMDSTIPQEILQAMGARARRVLRMLRVTTMESLLALTEEKVRSVHGIGLGTWKGIDRAIRQLARPDSSNTEALLHAGSDMAVSSPTPPFVGIVDQLGPRGRRALATLGISTATAFLSLTEEQVLSVPTIGQETWREIQRAKQLLIGVGQAACPVGDGPFSLEHLGYMPLYSRTPSPLLIVGRLHPTYHPDADMQELDLSTRARTVLAALRLTTLHQVLIVSPGALESQGNCGAKTVRDIQDAVRAFLMEKNGLCPTIEMSYISFEQMADCFLRIALHDNREMAVIRRRKGMGDGESTTLKELGTEFGVSRERIRQLEFKALERLRRPKTMRVLDPFWTAVQTLLVAVGGVERSATIAGALALHFRWCRVPDPAAVISFVTLHPQFMTCNDDSLILVDHVCPSCPRISNSLLTLVSDMTPEVPVCQATIALHAQCCAMCQQPTEVPEALSGALVEHVIRSRAELSSALRLWEGSVFTENFWHLRFGRLTPAIEGILKSRHSPMHFREVHAELRRWRGDTVSARLVHAALGHAENAVLWGRGEYIHANFVPEAESLVAQVEAWLLNALTTDIPCFSIVGAFARFRADCREHGIPSASALYSSLRKSQHHMLAYPRFPYVYRQEPGATHVPLSVVIEDWLRDAGDVVPYSRIRKLLCDEMGLKGYQMTCLHGRLANVIRTDDRGFVHLSALGIREEELAGLITHVEALFNNGQSCISIQKVFSGKAVTCHELGITGPRMLFSLLKRFAANRFDLGHYPLVRMLATEHGDESRGVTAEVLAFLADQGRPCTYAELEERFVDECEYAHHTVYAAFTRKDVNRYLRSCIVHRCVLGWTNDKQATLEELAQGVCEEAMAAGQYCGQVDTLLAEHEAALPTLDHGCQWTRVLLADLLDHGVATVLIGNAGNAFVVKPNRHDISNLGDLVQCMLNREYHGAASIEELSHRLRDTGVVQKSLTPGMLSRQTKVAVVDGYVLLKELV